MPVAERCQPNELEQLGAALPPALDAVHEGEELDVFVHRQIAVEGEALGHVAEAMVEGAARLASSRSEGRRLCRPVAL